MPVKHSRATGFHPRRAAATLADNAGHPRAISRIILLKQTINFRLLVACVAAASVGLSMAIISTAKLLVIICALAVLLNPRRSFENAALLAGKSTPLAVLVALSAFALSLLWTTAPMADSLGSLAKYGKLIVIVLLPLLIRDRREALSALAAFGLGQLFLLISSWMLFAQLPVPWATSHTALTANAVFSSYLDQGVIGAVFAVICWHLRALAPARLALTR